MLNFLTWFERIKAENITDFEDKDDQVTEAYKIVFGRLFPIYCVVFIALICLFFSNYISLIVVGLVYSAVGSLSLALSAVRGKGGIVSDVPDKISTEILGADKAVSEPAAVKARCRHSIHGVFGAGILMIGFVLQIIGSI